MKEYNNVLLILLFIAVLLIIYTYYPKSEPTISFSEFKNELNNSKNVSIVMDARNSPSTSVVFNCGIQLTQALENNGISPKKFAYDKERCSYSSSGATSPVLNASVDECESKLSNSTVFYLRYNAAKNSTSFYKSKAVIEGDENFLSECSIERLIS
ncbi:MAG: hypothetical protein NT130_04280 [Candidatus Micrarchaeota archaeon]|nr:hypothetical protein [Candidatus Micrarchaeota archaeon]